MKRCILLFSGGLDSVIAAHLLIKQNIEVIGLHFVLPFNANIGKTFKPLIDSAKLLDIQLVIHEEKEDFLEIVKKPKFGFGKNINPCIDCRIFRLKQAHKYMLEQNASFIATGEVVGQRPMSQHKRGLGIILQESGLSELLLRPLSAKLLEPTIAEKNNWVNREDFLAIEGRTRKIQLEYAKKHNLQYESPAGGCILTAKEIVPKYQDLVKHIPEYTLPDFKCLAYGRHFRLSPAFRLIIGRDQAENNYLEKLEIKSDYRIEMANITGPIGIGKGTPTAQDIQLACDLIARYSSDRKKLKTNVKVIKDGLEKIWDATPVSPQIAEKLRMQ